MTINLPNIFYCNCPLRTLEMVFQSFNISKLPGGACPHTPLWLETSTPRHLSSIVKQYPDFFSPKMVGQSGVSVNSWETIFRYKAFCLKTISGIRYQRFYSFKVYLVSYQDKLGYIGIPPSPWPGLKSLKERFCFKFKLFLNSMFHSVYLVFYCQFVCRALSVGYM